MEKRALVAVLLSVVVMVAWSWLFPPSKPPQQPTPVDRVETVDTAVDPEPIEGLPTESSAGITSADDSVGVQAIEETAAIEAVAEETLVVTTAHHDVTLSNRGGVATSWKLSGYRTSEEKPLELVAHWADSDRLPLAIALDDLTLADTINAGLFTVERLELSPSGDAGRGTRVTYRWSDGQGLDVTKVFTFRENSWLVDVNLEVNDRGRRMPARLSIGPGFAAQEPVRGNRTYAYRSQAVWNVAGQVTRRKKRKLVKEDGSISGRVQWAGLEDQYFAAVVLPSSEPAVAKWRSLEVTPVAGAATLKEDEEPEAAREPILSVSVDGTARLFVGPKDYRLLQATAGDVQLEKAVWFATNPFLAWITRYIYFSLVWLQSHVVSNYGFAIILATVILRILLFPVNQYSMVNMRKTQMQMQKIQPKVNAIRNKYKKAKDAQSRAKMNEETMALYKREGVNPMGGITGCLPMLAQFPILIGFYNMLTVAVELRGAPFMLWIQDLSQKDPFYLIPIAMAATMFLQQKMAMNKVKDPMQQQQQKIMMIMPFFFGWICMQMPAGMVLYWFVNNVLGIGQQWLVNRTAGRLETAPQKA